MLIIHEKDEIVLYVLSVETSSWNIFLGGKANGTVCIVKYYDVEAGQVKNILATKEDAREAGQPLGQERTSWE